MYLGPPATTASGSDSSNFSSENVVLMPENFDNEEDRSRTVGNDVNSDGYTRLSRGVYILLYTEKVISLFLIVRASCAGPENGRGNEYI